MVTSNQQDLSETTYFTTENEPTRLTGTCGTAIFQSRHVNLILPEGGQHLGVTVTKPRWWQWRRPTIFQYEVMTP